MSSRRKITEGVWFAVPLTEAGFSVGVVARVNPRGVLLGYFFGPRRDLLPTLEDCSGLSVGDALWVTRFGDLGLRDGTWPVLGTLDDWSRQDWPMPEFVRHEELSGRSFRVIYDDSDPSKLLQEIQVERGTAEQGFRDGLAGAGFVEMWLTDLMSE